MTSCGLYKKNFLTLLVLCFSISPTFAKYSGGTGTSTDPYLIETPQDMNAIGADSNDWNKCFKLIADINMAEFTGTKYKIIGNSTTQFTGVFDGNAQVISNLAYITTNYDNYIGMFGRTSQAILKNISIVNASFSTKGVYAGGLVAYSNGGIIANCYVIGSVKGVDNNGGLCGRNNSKIIDCFSNGSVTGSGSNTGGFCGRNDSIITNCYSSNTVGGDYSVGGFCGIHYGTIDKCYSTGNAYGGGKYIGGFCGSNLGGKIRNSFSNGNTSSSNTSEAVGGFCGYNNNGYIFNCYATGIIAGIYKTGGVCGHNKGATGNIINCYSTGDVTGYNPAGGICGQNEGAIADCYTISYLTYKGAYTGGACGKNTGAVINCYFIEDTGTDNGIGESLTEAQMKQQSSFMGFDFIDDNTDGTCSFWIMKPENYPKLYIFDINFVSHQFNRQGVTTDPYLIGDSNDLGAIWQQSESNYKLANNINLKGIKWSLAVIPFFSGSFDANNYIMSNLTISSSSYSGLFGTIESTAIIKNVVIEDVNIIGGNYSSSVCGYNSSGKIINCRSNGKVNGLSNVGGICGYNSSGLLDGCYFIGDIAGTNNTGVLCGYNSGKIINCFSTGNVSGEINVGGLCGYNYNNIKSSYSMANVSGIENAGGLCGSNYFATILNSFSSGDVWGSGYCTGGFCGYDTNGNICKCYSTGDVNSSHIYGGFCGMDSGGTLSDCFWNKEICDANGLGNGTSSWVVGRTTAEMKTLSTFTNAGWDFSYTDGNEAVWYISENDYPILTWQISPVDISTDGKNNFKDFASLAKYWMRDDCAKYNNYCDWADLDFSGRVDISDLWELMNYWLEDGIYEY
ncbi:MAG: hypothetical protein A2Y12_20125 [Planctomycetes bacterium GWF2_42_9]|nr:MAG: hypothetical protein A2Y12_20125 [Planctomycetes bacterium GWF2_42_9]HAL45090.1 hypothetical protein [Phycisphaerales bacterium]